MIRYFWMMTLVAGLAFSAGAQAAQFDECFEYSKRLEENKNTPPSVSEDGLRADWIINGSTLGCRVDAAGKLLSLITERGEMKRESLVKVVGASAGQVEYTDAEDKAFVDSGVKYLINRLKEPSSVQWRNVFIADRALQTLCGEINARNSYGGYTGFKRFYYTRNSQLTEVQGSGDEEIFLKMYASMCKRSRKEIEVSAAP